MAEIVKSVIVTIQSIDTQTNLDQTMASLNLNAEDFLTAVTVSEEEKNNLAKIAIFYKEEEA